MIKEGLGTRHASVAHSRSSKWRARARPCTAFLPPRFGKISTLESFKMLRAVRANIHVYCQRSRDQFEPRVVISEGWAGTPVGEVQRPL